MARIVAAAATREVDGDHDAADIREIGRSDLTAERMAGDVGERAEIRSDHATRIDETVAGVDQTERLRRRAENIKLRGDLARQPLVVAVQERDPLAARAFDAHVPRVPRPPPPMG